MSENPTFEDALDGLQTAVRYCEQQGRQELAGEIAALYQETGGDAFVGEWEGDPDE